jgi:aminomethyltransferase
VGSCGSSGRTFATTTGTGNSTNSEETPLRRTALYEFHQTMGGDMVAFAGYSLPIMYKGAPESSGIMNEHLWCRSPGKASIFDVSHMGQVRLSGTDRVKFLETLVVGDIQGLGEGDSCLSLLTNQNGGIIDDTVITNVGNVIDMVINGATKDTDLEHIRHQMSVFNGNVELDLLHDTHGLIAVQGSGAVEALLPLLPGNFDITKMKFMSSTDIRIHDVHCRMTRYVHVFT